MRSLKAAALLALIISQAVLGCAVRERLSPLTTSFLTDVDITKKMDNMPFVHSWVWNEPPAGSYDKIYLKPIRTDFIPEDHWTRSMSVFITSKDDYQQVAREIADYFHSQLIEHLSRHPKPRFKLVDEPGPRTVVIEIALTELELSHPGARAGALAAPVPGVEAAVSAVSDPHAAFALRATDGENERLIATAADRKYSPLRILDLNKLTVKSSVHEICQDWSEELAEALNKGRMARVESVGRFRLLPW